MEEVVYNEFGWWKITYFDDKYGGEVEGNLRGPRPKKATSINCGVFEYRESRGYSLNRMLNSLDFLLDESIPLQVVRKPELFTEKQIKAAKSKLPSTALIQPIRSR